jgi:F-box/leucine-rich repeat protein 10/11
MPAAAKKTKQESTSPMTQSAAFFNHEDDDEQMAQSEFTEAFGHQSIDHVHTRKHAPEDEAPQGEALYASPPAFQAESVDAKDLNAMSVSSSKPNTSLVSPPTSLADEMDGIQEGDAVQSVEGEASTALHTPNSSSRHSSRQPRHVDRFAPEATVARAPKPTVRASYSTIGARKTTPPPPSSTRKPSSRPSSSHAKKSSPMYERHFHRHAPTSLSPRQHKHTQHLTEDEDADEESLRLIRELQEQEFGLRKRSTRV